jgi:hypothetical protein
VETTWTGFYHIVVIGYEGPVHTHVGAGIDAAVVFVLPEIDEAGKIFRLVAATGFVAIGHHAKGRVVAIRLRHADGLVVDELVDGLAVTQGGTVVGPGRPFGLEIEPDAAGCFEGCFRRAVGMEPHVVEAEAAGDAENAFPTYFVHGGIAGEGKFAVLDGTAEMDQSAVDGEVSALGAELAHAEFDDFSVGSKCGREPIEGGIEFIPGEEVVAHRQVDIQ